MSLNHGQICIENVNMGKRVSDAYAILCMLTISNIKVKT